MTEKVSIEKQTIESVVETHVEAAQENDLGSMNAQIGFVSGGLPVSRPLAQLQRAELGNFLERLTRIDTWTLATTDSDLSVLDSVDPWGALIVNTVIARKLYDYRYIRATLEVEFTVNVPAGCYGLYYIVAVPNGSSKFGATDYGFTIEVVECCPHVMIDIAAATKGKLTLPWIGWNDYGTLSTSTTPDSVLGMWDLKLVCYRAIAQGNGTTTPQGSIAVYVRCASDVDLVIPYQQAGEFKLSGVAGAVSQAASAVANVPIIGAFAAPLAVGAAAVGTLLDLFGFTRKTEQRVPQPVVNRPFSNIANYDVNDTSEVAAMSVTNTLSMDPRIVEANPDDTGDIDALSMRYVLVAASTWTPSDATGTMLVRIPVTPFYSYKSITNSGVLTMSGFIGLPFTKWRGDMEYKVVIPFCKFHRGTLQIAWTPGSTITADPTNIQYNEIFDVVPSKYLEYIVGYANSRPLLTCTRPLSAEDTYSTTGANGSLHISVVNPLECSAESASTVIYVFARARPGMHFSVPRVVLGVPGESPEETLHDFVSTIQLQSGALGDDVSQTVSRVLVPSIGAYPVKDVCVGEEFRSIRALVQKFTQAVGLGRAFGNQPETRLAITHLPVRPGSSQYLSTQPSTVNALTWFDWFGWYASLFVGVASSVRYKVVNTNDVPIVIAFYPFPTDGGRDMTTLVPGSTFNTVAPTWVVQPGEAVEVCVPFYFVHKYLPTSVAISAVSVVNGTNEGRVNVLSVTTMREPDVVAETVYPSVVVYTAAGPDVRLHVARFPRPIDVNAGTFFGPIYGNTPHDPGPG